MQQQIQEQTASADALLSLLTAALTDRRPLVLSGVRGGGKGWLLSSLARRVRVPLVVVCDTFQRAETLLGDLAFFCPERPAQFFPHWDTMPYDGFSPQKDVIAQRFEALAALAAGHGGCLVTTVQGLMQGMLPLREFLALRFELARGERYARAELLGRLVEAGYARVDLTEAPGEFSVRGEIVDIFSIQEEHPTRLDFFDDELESLHSFDVTSQRSLEPCERLSVYPASEGAVNARTARHARAHLPDHKSSLQPEVYRQLWSYLEQGTPFPGFEQLLPLFHGSADWLLDHLPPEAVVFLDEPAQITARAEEFHEEVQRELAFALQQGNLALPAELMYLSPKALQARLGARYTPHLEGLRLEGHAHGVICPFVDNQTLRSQAIASRHEGHRALEGLIESIKGWRDGGAPVFLATRSGTGAERVRQVLAQFDIGAVVAAPSPEALDAAIAAAGEAPTAPRDIVVLTGTPREGFRLVDDEGRTRFALITEEELFGEKTRQRHLKKSKLQNFMASLGDLKQGDAVVHVEYGIGRYEGLQTLRVGGESGDFLVLAYAGDDKVYVPVYHFNQVQKFTGTEGRPPVLNRLGDGTWQRSKQRAAKEIQDMAEELVRVHAARKARAGTAFDPHSPYIAEFEEAFPFEETEDQRQAIAEVLSDMASGMPMDRLVCGDVGFGKTEVAMRAAYLAVLGGKQVLMLVPTTILVQQHQETFRQRFADFPVHVEGLSRFRKPREQKAIVKAFAAGEIDILIGTHRLLSKDVVPKDLGLLIIDEEQRFGVAHKERIKRLRNQVDVVALSATPIPRTLHMSLLGVRDLSVINTPPMDRMAIRTRLVKSSDYILREAVEREIRRGGQVFVVHNRVETIHAFGSYLQGLLPRVRIAIAHGQMAERQLEEVMLSFVHGEVQVLLSTTIIESGLDIPRANTIVVNQADHFGLAQLYQLRGRVGRSNVQAYAFLLVSPEKILTDLAQKRLSLLQELNDLGAGFRIAAHDLEIRGAGNLLGSEQSGHINAIGLELFTQMVADAVADLSQEDEQRARVTTADFKLDLGFPYILPERYIESTQQRLDVYKRLAEIRGEEELWQTREMLEDRFGKMPQSMADLFELIQVRLAAIGYGLAALERAGGQLQARFSPGAAIDMERLLQVLSNPEAGLKLLPGDRLLLGPMPATPAGVLERLGILASIMRPQAA